jgi:hypothetical protein
MAALSFRRQAVTWREMKQFIVSLEAGVSIQRCVGNRTASREVQQ